MLNKPTNRLFSRLSVLIQRNTQAPVELLDVVGNISYEQMLQCREQAFSHYFVETFMHGNWASDEAKRFANNVRELNDRANGSPYRARSLNCQLVKACIMKCAATMTTLRLYFTYKRHRQA